MSSSATSRQGSESTPTRSRAGARAAAPLALVLCGAYLALGLWLFRTPVVLAPDTAHYADAARHLARGDGLVIDLIPFHPGAYPAIRHIPEMHGLLRPVTLAGLFAVLGEKPQLTSVPGIAYVALTGLVAFFFARRVFGAVAGLLSCVLVLTAVPSLLWAGIGADDVGLAFYFLVAVALLHEAIVREQEGRAGTVDLVVAAGLASGLGVLEKLLGIVLAPLAALVLLGLWRSGARRVATLWLAFGIPFALCFSVYLVRNEAAYGSFGFRFGAMNWLYTHGGVETMLAMYPRAPTMTDVIGSIGPGRVVEIVLEQIRLFLAATVQMRPWNLGAGLMVPPPLFWLGTAAAVLHAIRRPAFGGPVVLAWLGIVSFICLLYHVELRYFAPLIPLLTIAFAGAAMAPGGSRMLRGLGGALGAAAALASVAAFAGLAGQLARGQLLQQIGPCDTTHRWIERHTGADEPVMSLNPWLMAWETERPAVMMPSGGPGPIAAVARHYGVRWLVIEPTPLRPETMRIARQLPRRSLPGFRVVPAAPRLRCPVFRVETDPPRRPRLPSGNGGG